MAGAGSKMLHHMEPHQAAQVGSAMRDAFIHGLSGALTFSCIVAATGAALESTNFLVPWSAPRGAAELCLVANGISSDCAKVHVYPHRVHIPHYEAWNWLVGNLADGPLWVIGRHGPHPIGPFNGRLAKRAKQAYATIRKGVEELEVLGREVDARRAATESEAISTRPSGERHRKAREKTAAKG